MVIDKIPMQFKFSDSGMLIPRKYNIENLCWMNKPLGGLWTSTVVGVRTYTVGINTYNIPYSDWMDWCLSERFKVEDKILIIHPKKDLKVYDINQESDLMGLPIIKGDLFNCIDYEQLQKDNYDGVHISAYIAYKLHLHSINKIMFNSWDSESTCWFNMDWINSYKVIDFSSIKRSLNII